MADDDRSIRLHYDGLCFEENDGEHRMEPATGEEVIRFSDQSAAYASRFYTMAVVKLMKTAVWEQTKRFTEVFF